MSLDVNISEPEEFNCVELHSSLKDLADVLGISDFEYHVDHISGGTRENFISNIFRVIIRDTDNKNDVSVIVKTLVNTARQELFHDLHQREVDAYKEILPKFKKIQHRLEESQKISFPECLHSNAEKTKEVIIFNDLYELGFTEDDTVAKFEELQFSKIELVLTQLAKFHALSFVYKNEDIEEFTRVKKNFCDILFQDNLLRNLKLRNYYFESFDMSLSVVENLEAKKKLEKIRPKLLDLLKTYHGLSKYNVFCHGDLWINNVFFRENNNQTEVCFLDFQAMRYTSPVTDIIYFMYLSTTSQFRSEHFQALLSTYYDSLNSALKFHDLDVNIVYPREDFDEDVRDKLPFGLLMALVELRIITTTVEDDAILKGSAFPGSSLTDFGTVRHLPDVSLFRLRVNDLVQECVDNGVLDELMNKMNS